MDCVWVVGEVEKRFTVGAAITDEALEDISRCGLFKLWCR